MIPKISALQIWQGMWPWIWNFPLLFGITPWLFWGGCIVILVGLTVFNARR